MVCNFVIYKDSGGVDFLTELCLYVPSIYPFLLNKYCVGVQGGMADFNCGKSSANEGLLLLRRSSTKHQQRCFSPHPSTVKASGVSSPLHFTSDFGGRGLIITKENTSKCNTHLRCAGFFSPFPELSLVDEYNLELSFGAHRFNLLNSSVRSHSGNVEIGSPLAFMHLASGEGGRSGGTYPWLFPWGEHERKGCLRDVCY